MPVIRELVLVFLALAFTTTLGAAPSPWLEVKSAHFVVITNAGEKTGRRTAWEFEQIRSALLALWPWAKIDSGRPFVVFAAEDEVTLKTLGPQYWEGKRFRPTSFGAVGPDTNFIALRTDIQGRDEFGVNPYKGAFWSYTASVFGRSFPRPLPRWYACGVAELMSNTIVREKELRVGIPRKEDLRLLREFSVIPLSEFLSADSRSRWLTQEIETPQFYAQAWALVHYLMFGENRAFAAKLNRFNKLLHDGTALDMAMKEALGDIQPYYEATHVYAQKGLFAYTTIPVSLDTRQEGYSGRPLAAAEAATERGLLLVAMNRPAEARARAAEAAKADPNSPGQWEIEAALLDHEGQKDDARAAFEKAVAAGSTNSHVYFRLAQLEWKGNADKALLERLSTLLEQARQLRPDSARVLSFLADIRAAQGQPDEALAFAKKAVEIEPAGSHFRLSLARVLWKFQHGDEAIQVAGTALQAAETDAERRAVQGFLDQAGRARPDR